MLQAAILLLGLFIVGQAAIAQEDRKVELSLMSETATVHPGQTLRLAVKQTIAPGWHTYWINPGDAGEPMVLDWSLPDGFRAGPIEWPLPEPIPVSSLTNYGYTGEALFLVALTVPEALSVERVELSVKGRWLVCEEVCIPEEGSAKLTLSVVSGPAESMLSSRAATIAAAQKALPLPSPWPASFAADERLVQLEIKGLAQAVTPLNKPMLFPLEWGIVKHERVQKVSTVGRDVRFELPRGDLKNVPPATLKGLLVFETEENGVPVRKGYWLEAANTGMAPIATALSSPEGLDAAQGRDAAGLDAGIGLPLALLFAVLGGLILNLMPCVFPVLSLKALSLAQNPAHGRSHGLAYFAGVMASFAALAGVMLALQAGGSAIGWGFQFQSPLFVLLMAALFLALALSLSGVFTLGGGLMGLGDSLARRGGLQGSLFTGVLAAIAATPCTAPFMGAALGYALMRPAGETVLIVLALGLGFALPMLLLSVTPALLRRLPRPGAWMETLKQVLAFPLYATVGWLVWVLSVQTGSAGVLAAAVALTGVAFAAWLYGRSQQGGALWARAAAPVTALAVLIVAGGLVQGVRAPSPGSSVAAGPVETAEPFSQRRLAELRAQGRAVFVNFTAAWCITCKVNETVAFSAPEVKQAFADNRIVYMTADWTNYDPEITAVLRSFGRAGVPLYVFYPGGGANVEPVILPQLLTPGIVAASLKPQPLTQAKGVKPQ